MLLQTLATKHKDADVGREEALAEFSDRSGLNVRASRMIDKSSTMRKLSRL